MTLTGLTLRGSDLSSRWLMLASLALNLFFIGVVGALLLQAYGFDAPATPAAGSDRSVAGRIERIAATLPREDAEKLRAGYRARREEIDGARAAYRDRQDAMRAVLRAEPFDLEALKAAMAEMRAARQNFDRRIHDFFAQQASQMSPAGRQKLADRPGSRREQTTSQSSKN
jgi:uncharacterized membrane protein